MARLLRDVLRLVRSWWRCDRIRVGPEEGGLLRLQPGGMVSTRGECVEVVRRVETCEGGEGRVEYWCEGSLGEIVIALGARNGREVWVRRENGEGAFVAMEEVGVWREGGSSEGNA